VASAVAALGSQGDDESAVDDEVGAADVAGEVTSQLHDEVDV
jgi:hypothetical protein